MYSSSRPPGKIPYNFGPNCGIQSAERGREMLGRKNEKNIRRREREKDKRYGERKRKNNLIADSEVIRCQE